MRRNPEEGALPMALPASRTRSLEADMGHLPGNLAGKPDFARSRGHLPGKSPRAGAEGRLGTDLSIGSQWVAGLDLLVCSRLRVRAMAERLGRREDRSWPSQSEAGAARTWFPRRPLKRVRAIALPLRGVRAIALPLRGVRAIALPISGVRPGLGLLTYAIPASSQMRRRAKRASTTRIRGRTTAMPFSAKRLAPR